MKMPQSLALVYPVFLVAKHQRTPLFCTYSSLKMSEMQQAEETTWNAVKAPSPRRHRSHNNSRPNHHHRRENNRNHSHRNRRANSNHSISPPTWLQNLQAPSNRTSFEPFILLLQGMPGSGKSTLAQKLCQVMPHKFVRINQDDLGTRRRCLFHTRQALEQGKCPIIDRCNAGPAHRKPFLELAGLNITAPNATASNETAAQRIVYPVDCLILDVPKEVCLRRCRARANHPTVTPQNAAKVMGCMKADWQLPSTEESRLYRNLWRVTVSNRTNDEQEELRLIVEESLLK